MKFLLSIILIFSFSNFAIAENNLQFFIDSALKNNLKLNAERKNQKSIKQNINISRSEFLPNISISGDQSSSNSTNKTDHGGSNVSDSNLDTETKTISVDQKVFQGFKTSYGVQFVKFGLAGVQASVLLNTPEQFITFKTSHPDLLQIHK